jgi:hypothetical protein
MVTIEIDQHLPWIVFGYHIVWFKSWHLRYKRRQCSPSGLKRGTTRPKNALICMSHSCSISWCEKLSAPQRTNFLKSAPAFRKLLLASSTNSAVSSKEMTTWWLHILKVTKSIVQEKIETGRGVKTPTKVATA